MHPDPHSHDGHSALIAVSDTFAYVINICFSASQEWNSMFTHGIYSIYVM